MVVSERRRAVGLEVLCALLGYTRQAYYKHQHREEQEAIEAELIVKEVLRQYLQSPETPLLDRHADTGRGTYQDR